MAPEVTSVHGDSPVALRITAYASAANVTISEPANPAFTPITIAVPANKQVTVSSDNAAYNSIFKLTNLENNPVNTINKVGLHITSGQNVSVYYEVVNASNPDIFTLKGENALGTEFYVPSQNYYSNHFQYTTAFEHVDVVATEDNTVITIVPTAELVGGATAGVPITVTLNKGQTYGITCKSTAYSASLGGTYIKSTKKIAVTVSDDSINQYTNVTGSWDLIGDQNIPTSIIGTEYIAVKTSSESKAVNNVFLLAIEDGTWVTVDGSASFNLNKGEIRCITIDGNSDYIKSNVPIYAYQVSGLPVGSSNSNEFGSALLPSISCTGSKRVSFTRNFGQSFWVQFVAQKRNISSFKMYDSNNQEVNYLSSLSWKVVDATNDGRDADEVFYTAIIDLSQNGISTGRPYYVENTKGLFHLSVLDKNGGSMSYGYFSSYSSVKIEPPTQTCIGQAVVLQSKYTEGSYYWTSSLTGDTIISTEPSITVTESGTYYLALDADYGCNAIDALEVNFTQPDIDLGADREVCPGEDVTLTVDDSYVSYEWSGNSTSHTLTYTPTTPGTTVIKIEVTDDQGCTATDEVTVTTYVGASVDLSMTEDEICEGDSVEVEHSNVSSFTWEIDGVAVPDAANLNYLVLNTAGTYVITVTGTSDDGCQSAATKTITVNPLPVVSLTDTMVCANTDVVFTGPAGMVSYQWNGGNVGTQSSYTAQIEGSVELIVVDANGCSAAASANVAWYAEPNVDISYHSTDTNSDIQPSTVYACPENQVVLTAPSGFTNYTWVHGTQTLTGATETSVIVTPVAGGQTVVTLTVVDANGCEAEDQVTVIGYTSPTVQLDKTAYCVGETMSATTGFSRYQWEFGGVVVSTSRTYIPLVNGTYTLTAWDANSCVTASVNAVVNPLPDVSINGTEVCPDIPYVFTGNSSVPVTYSWSQELTAVDAAKSYTSQTFQVTNANAVWLVVTDGNGCKAKASAVPSWYPGVEAEISYVSNVTGTDTKPDQISLCPESSIVLNADVTTSGSTGLAYRWYLDNNLLAETSDALTLSGLTSGNHTLRLEVEDGNGCTDIDTVTLNVYEGPQSMLDLIVDDICLGETLTVNAIRTTMGSHLWEYEGTSSTAYSIIPTQGGTVKLTVLTKNGCTDSKEIVVHDPQITLTDLSPSVYECANSPHTFAVVPESGVSYTWYNSSVQIVSTTSSYTATAVGTYSVVATDALGCKSDETDVELQWLPSKIFTFDEVMQVCNMGITYKLEGNSDMTDYVWMYRANVGDSWTNLNNNTNEYTVTSNTQAGFYRVSAVYSPSYAPSLSCSIEQEFELIIPLDLEPLTIDQNNKCNDGTICICEGDEIVLHANYDFVTYQWSEGEVDTNGDFINGVDLPGENGPTLKVDKSGTYQLSVEQKTGCPTKGHVTVDVKENPDVSLDADGGYACLNDKVLVSNASPNANEPTYSYQWTYNKEVTTGGSSFEVDATRSGTYNVSVLVTDSQYGCTSEAAAVVDVPSALNLTLADVTICSNETLDVSTKFDQSTVTGYVSHQWYKVDGAGNLLPIAEDAVLGGNDGGRYKLYVKAAHASYGGIECTYEFDFYLFVVQAPLLNSTDPDPICQGESVVLDAGGDYDVFRWTSLDHASLTLPNTRHVEVTEDGRYQIEAWVTVSGKTCTSIGEISVAINPIPGLSVSSDRIYLCKDGNVTLSVSNSLPTATTYVWSTGTVGPSITVVQSGYYSVQATDANLCSADAGIDVIDYVITPVELDGLPAVCNGETVLLPAINNVYTYQWYYNNVGNALQGAPNSSWQVGTGGTYVLSYLKEADGCEVLETLDLVVNPLPVLLLSAQPSTMVCDGTTVVLDAGNDYPLYRWTNLTTGDVVGYDRTCHVSVSGNYQVEAWTSAGCSALGTIQVTVYTNPSVNLGANFTVCPGTSFSLSLPASTVYPSIEWSTGATNTYSVTASSPGDYWVRVIDANGCQSEGTITVAAFNATTVNLTPLSPICDNRTVTLSSPFASGSIQSYQWYYDHVGNSVAGNTNSSWEVSAPGNYVLHVLDNNGCEATGTLTLRTIESPKFDLGPDRAQCVGDEITIEVQGTYVKYVWNGVDMGLQNSYALDAAGQHTITLDVTARNGCMGSDEVDITVNPLPDIDLGDDVYVCPDIISTLTASTSSSSIRWSTGETSNSIHVGHGTFTATVTDGNGCSDSDEVTVVWRNAPYPSLGVDALICPLDELVLDPGEFVSYLWHTGATSRTITASIVDTLNKVTVHNEYGCEGWATKQVFHMEAPDYEISPDTVLCANYTLTLDAGEEYVFFQWNTGETGRTIEVSEPGTYWAIANDGCVVVTDTVKVGFWATPVIALLDTMVYAQITIWADGGTSPYQYSLNEGRLQKENVFKNLGNGTYDVYVEDANGCYTTDLVAISSVYDLDIPNFFTPNGDGFNDGWKVDGLERFPDSEISIFDRYGKLLARFNGSTGSWDGRYLGKPMQSDDYWYVINLVHVKKSIKGNITLKR
ncbi:MAG: T9SS type B sorting domain-containing protein [Breznakibacter sp.]